ncbi:ubiquinone/menaquinone biosynthesis methyltransferases family protein [Cryptosporidium serpentis]
MYNQKLLCNFQKHILRQINKIKRVPLRIYPSCYFSSYSDSQTNENPNVDFGFQKVTEQVKRKLVHNVFSYVSDKYDLMNDLMSLGIHRYWKDIFVNTILEPESFSRLQTENIMPYYLENGKLESNNNCCKSECYSILDVAGGTGDIALKITDVLRKTRHFQINELPMLTVLDSNDEMIKKGQERALKEGYSNVMWLCDDGETLSKIPDNSIDILIISFGIRNFTDIFKALKSFNRVLKPGGRFLCLEFSNVNNPILSYFYKLYSFNIIPCLGKIIVGDHQPYQYLVESIQKFPSRYIFGDMISNADFESVTFADMTFGVVTIYSAFKKRDYI